MIYTQCVPECDNSAELNLAAFQFVTFKGSFLRSSDGAYMQFSPDITLIECVEVPEPDSAASFAIAAGGLWACGACATQQRGAKIKTPARRLAFSQNSVPHDTRA